MIKLEQIERLDLAAIMNEEIVLDMLLNEDALLNLSYSEKVLYKLMSQGESSRECAEQTGLPLATVSWHRARFWERARSAVLFSRLAIEMAKGMPERRKNKRYTKGEEIPYFSGFENGILLGFEKSKYNIHKNGRIHLSAIILVALLEPHSGGLCFLVADAASKALTVNNNSTVSPHNWEIPGGHCKRADIPGAEIGKPLPAETREVLAATAKRELNEELYIKSTPLDMNRLHYLCEDRSESPDNLEHSGFYLYRYNGKKSRVSSGDVRFRDQWTTPLGSVAKRQWVAMPRNYYGESGLREDFMKNPSHYSDALTRCLRIMQNDDSFVKKIEGLLKAEEGISGP
ncbi:MAG: NUDIX domain-containing protein [Clostridiales bacterium]|jgi:8-oxo-dGTP pyrophosphatase MutT (NUDIX family)|nr:NUDIX domain-containing protein [Clostridiales bacterium]